MSTTPVVHTFYAFHVSFLCIGISSEEF